MRRKGYPVSLRTLVYVDNEVVGAGDTLKEAVADATFNLELQARQLEGYEVRVYDATTHHLTLEGGRVTLSALRPQRGTRFPMGRL